MKSLILSFLLFAVLGIIIAMYGCNQAGTTSKFLNENEESNLPPELKGLKVYKVSDGIGGNIKVALMPNKNVVSSTYLDGKIYESTIVIQDSENNTARTFSSDSISFEDANVIIIRK
jgi:hypothetical protein